MDLSQLFVSLFNANSCSCVQDIDPKTCYTNDVCVWMKSVLSERIWKKIIGWKGVLTAGNIDATWQCRNGCDTAKMCSEVTNYCWTTKLQYSQLFTKLSTIIGISSFSTYRFCIAFRDEYKHKTRIHLPFHKNIINSVVNQCDQKITAFQ